MTEKLIRSTWEMWKRENEHTLYLSINWRGFCVISTYQFSRKALTSIPIHIARSELNTATCRPTLQIHYSSKCSSSWNVLTASTIWAQKNFDTLHSLHKAVDGTEYIQFRSIERNSKMTGRGDTDSRFTAPDIFSTVIPTKRMCTLRR